MDNILFFDWFTNIFLPEVKERHKNTTECPRKVFLLLDNAPSHHSIIELNRIDETVQVCIKQENHKNN